MLLGARYPTIVKSTVSRRPNRPPESGCGRPRLGFAVKRRVTLGCHSSYKSAFAPVSLFFFLTASRERRQKKKIELVGYWPTFSFVLSRIFPPRSQSKVSRPPKGCSEYYILDSVNGYDPSAGSPTETLLRLLLPLKDQVRASFSPAVDSLSLRELPPESRKPDGPVRRPH